MRKIKLTQGKFALVSDEDFDRVSEFKWTAHRGSASRKRWYAIRNEGVYVDGVYKRVWVRLHRFILDLPPGTLSTERVVDHIDNDGLNNQRENLEEISRSENAVRAVARKKKEEPFL